MSTYELNFGMPYGLTTMSLYVDVGQAELASRQYVVCVEALAGDEAVDLESVGWTYSHNLQAKFCYLPESSVPGVVRLPPLSVGREISILRVGAPRLGPRGAPRRRRSHLGVGGAS